VTAGGVRQQRWIRSGSSFCSAGDLMAHFGLGAASVAETVTLTWPSGVVQTLRGVKARQTLAVREPGAEPGR
jgi:enediyne biosynthesis protein E4